MMMRLPPAYEPKNRKSVVLRKFFRRDLTIWTLAVPTLILFFIFNWQPLFETIWFSFFKLQGYRPVQFIGLQNYHTVLSNSMFLQTLINTFMYVFWSLIIGFPVPIIAAILINEMRRAQGFFKFAVYLPTMVPAVVSSLLWTNLYQPDSSGLLNRFLSIFGMPASAWLQNSHLTVLLIIITATWGGFGGTTLLYLASLQGVNPELYDAASIDGANVWKRLINITIPQIAPIISILLILQIIGVFQILIQPLAMTSGGPNNASMSLLLLSYYYAFKFLQPGDSMVLGVITFIILLLMTAGYFKLDKKFSA